MNSNRNYVTENINLRQQIIDLKNANKDKYECIKSLEKEVMEYNDLRKRFKILYEENQKLKKAIEILKDKTNLKIKFNNSNKPFITYDLWGSSAITKQEYELLKEVSEWV